MKYRVVLERSEEGVAASVPGLPGCWSQGESEAEALENIRAAITEYLEAVEDLTAACVTAERGRPAVLDQMSRRNSSSVRPASRTIPPIVTAGTSTSRTSASLALAEWPALGAGRPLLGAECPSAPRRASPRRAERSALLAERPAVVAGRPKRRTARAASLGGRRRHLPSRVGEWYSPTAMAPSSSFLTLDRKGRATLPEEVRSALGVEAGDFILLEQTERGTFELVPAALVPKDQLWFHHPEVQGRVARSEQDFAAGRSTRTETPEEAQSLLDSLKSEPRKRLR
jgi:predicted RNase H-like HicB family nuclease/bifunctional DNA-binding transcriptional regulator/antitoxin component of YhaV-PrlF toxin-antitoxin module